MNPRLIAAVAVCVLLAAGVAVYAMPPGLFSPPVRQPAKSAWRVGPQDVKLTVVTDPKLKAPRLLIPRSLLVTTTPEPKRVGAAGRIPAVMAGLALSSALVVGGLWLAGKGGRRTRAAALVLGVLAVIGAGTAWADIPAPWWQPRPPRPGPPFMPPVEKPEAPPALKLPANVTLPADIQIEVVDAGEGLRLAIPGAARPAAPLGTPGR